MKKLLLYLIFTLFVLQGCNNGNKLLRIALTKKIYTFFTETLRENYQSYDEVELYKCFLADYLNNKQNILLENLDKKQLNVISHELFKRDSDHYYFFYSELISFKANQKTRGDAYEFFAERYPDTPISVVMENWSKTVTNEWSVNDFPIVYLNMQDNGFFNKINTKKNTSIQSVKENIDRFYELNLNDLARFYLKGEGAEELNKKAVRKFLAVAYWKWLCSKANIDFHDVYNSQKNKFINEFVQTQPLKRIEISNDMESFTTGYVNLKGDTVIPIGKYSYCYTQTFDTIAIVALKDTTGFYAIDRNEKILFQVHAYDNGPDYINNGLFRMIQNGKTGYANMQGSVIIIPEFDFALPFRNGFAVVAFGGKEKIDGEYSGWEGGKWGLIDTNGKFVIKPEYDCIYSVNEKGEVSVERNGRREVLELQ